MHGSSKLLTVVPLTANGHSDSDNVENKRHVILAIDTANSANLRLRVKGSIAKVVPDFSGQQTKDNQWTFVQSKNLADNSDVNGADGVVVSGTDTHVLLEVNTNGLKYVAVELDNYVAGEANVLLRAFND